MKRRSLSLLSFILLLLLLAGLASLIQRHLAEQRRSDNISKMQELFTTIEFVVEHAKQTATLEGAGEQPRSSYSNPPRVYILDQLMELKYGYPEAYADRPRGGDLLDLFDISEEFAICYDVDCREQNSSSVKIGLDVTEDHGCYVKYSEPGDESAPSAKRYGLFLVTSGC